MHSKPNRLGVRPGPNHPMLLMHRYLQPIPRPHTHLPPIFKLQPRGALQQQHKLVMVLFVPAVPGRGMAFGDDALDGGGFCLDQGFEWFFGPGA